MVDATAKRSMEAKNDDDVQADLFKYLDEMDNNLEVVATVTKPDDDDVIVDEEEKISKKRKKKVAFKPDKEEEEYNEAWAAAAGVDVVLNNWLQQILFIESTFKTSKSLQLQIDEALDKLRVDGLLSSNDFEELKAIGKLWYELVELTYCYYAGSISNKKRLIEVLLELYSLKQLTREVFVNTCVQL